MRWVSFDARPVMSTTIIEGQIPNADNGQDQDEDAFYRSSYGGCRFFLELVNIDNI